MISSSEIREWSNLIKTFDLYQLATKIRFNSRNIFHSLLCSRTSNLL